MGTFLQLRNPVAYLLHTSVQTRYFRGAFGQLAGQFLGLGAGEFLLGALIMERMLEACPEVHCDRAQLNFDLYRLLFNVQENRYFHYQVQAAIAAGLGILDVVLALDECYVVLLQQTVREQVDIVYV